jgi:hypothetical protein
MRAHALNVDTDGDGRPDASGPFALQQLQPAVSAVAVAEAQSKDPVWYRLLERFGFPTLVALGLAYGFVGYNKQVREDRATDIAQYSKMVTSVSETNAKALTEVKSAIDKQGVTLEQIRDSLRETQRDNRGSGGR